MRVEKRQLAKGPKRVLFIAESEEESKILDWAFWSKVTGDGIIAHVRGEIRLSDGHREHYAILTGERIPVTVTPDVATTKETP